MQRNRKKILRQQQNRATTVFRQKKPEIYFTKIFGTFENDDFYLYLEMFINKRFLKILGRLRPERLGTSISLTNGDKTYSNCVELQLTTKHAPVFNSLIQSWVDKTGDQLDQDQPIKPLKLSFLTPRLDIQLPHRKQ